MRIVNTFWTPDINMHVIKCGCGSAFQHRADRWKIRCRGCGEVGHLKLLREELVMKNGAGKE